MVGVIKGRATRENCERAKEMEEENDSAFMIGVPGLRDCWGCHHCWPSQTEHAWMRERHNKETVYDTLYKTFVMLMH